MKDFAIGDEITTNNFRIPWKGLKHDYRYAIFQTYQPTPNNFRIPWKGLKPDKSDAYIEALFDANNFRIPWKGLKLDALGKEILDDKPTILEFPGRD
ncbi:hypothetical protein MHK_005365 [Candidatus Magnetomorum sp. HK-1]|nr:hypothetical protein MHK_005365 [Candidatus Magnetomorum sp. HK-1]